MLNIVLCYFRYTIAFDLIIFSISIPAYCAYLLGAYFITKTILTAFDARAEHRPGSCASDRRVLGLSDRRAVARRGRRLPAEHQRRRSAVFRLVRGRRRRRVAQHVRRGGGGGGAGACAGGPPFAVAWARRGAARRRHHRLVVGIDDGRFGDGGALLIGDDGQ